MKKCPYCIADIRIEAKKCKFCGEWVERPEPAAPGPTEMKLTVQPPTRPGPTKACPYCSAEIPGDAWTCMYCKQGVIGGKPAAVGGMVIFAFIAAIFFFGFWLPGCIEMQKKHESNEEQWQRIHRMRQDQDKFLVR